MKLMKLALVAFIFSPLAQAQIPSLTDKSNLFVRSECKRVAEYVVDNNDFWGIKDLWRTRRSLKHSSTATQIWNDFFKSVNEDSDYDLRVNFNWYWSDAYPLVPWVLQNSGNPAANEFALIFQVKHLMSFLFAKKAVVRSSKLDQLKTMIDQHGVLYDSLKQYLQTSLNISPSQIDPKKSVRLFKPKAKALFEDEPETDPFAWKIRLAKLGAYPICFYYGAGFNCAKIISESLDIGRPFGVYGGSDSTVYLSFVQEARSLFSDNKYYKGTIQFALKLIHYSENTSLPHQDLYSELIESFAYLGEEGSNEAAWKWLAVYSSRGASWAVALSALSEASLPVLAAMMISSSTMALLDAHDFTKTKKLFSIPPRAHAECYFGKPYHFWAAAYLAHRAALNGHTDVRSIVTAIHSLGVMYEALSDTIGRDPVDLYEDESRIIEASARISTVFRNAGAVFGVTSNRQKGMDCDYNLPFLRSAISSKKYKVPPEFERDFEYSLKDKLKFINDWDLIVWPRPILEAAVKCGLNQIPRSPLKDRSFK